MDRLQAGKIESVGIGKRRGRCRHDNDIAFIEDHAEFGKLQRLGKTDRQRCAGNIDGTDAHRIQSRDAGGSQRGNAGRTVGQFDRVHAEGAVCAQIRGWNGQEAGGGVDQRRIEACAESHAGGVDARHRDKGNINVGRCGDRRCASRHHIVEVGRRKCGKPIRRNLQEQCVAIGKACADSLQSLNLSNGHRQRIVRYVDPDRAVIGDAEIRESGDVSRRHRRNMCAGIDDHYLVRPRFKADIVVVEGLNLRDTETYIAADADRIDTDAAQFGDIGYRESRDGRRIACDDNGACGRENDTRVMNGVCLGNAERDRTVARRYTVHTPFRQLPNVANSESGDAGRSIRQRHDIAADEGKARSLECGYPCKHE